MKYSVLLTAYDPEKKLVEMTQECISRIKENSKNYELIILDRKGIESDVNRGFREAKGEYIILIGNDVMVDDPKWLEKLAVPGTITSFRKTYMPMMDFHELDASCICFPKDVREKVGFYDEAFLGGYGFCDDDYLFRAHLLGIPFKEVDVNLTHLISQTENTYYKDLHEGRMARNAGIFREKWLDYLKK